METKVIIGLILLLLVFFSIAVWFANSVAYTKGVSDKEICRMSVIAKWAGKKASFYLTDGIIDLKCNTQIIEINRDSVLKNGKEIETMKEITDSGTEEKIKRIVANEMYDCWYQFSRGQFDFTQAGIMRNANICVVCSEITFSKEIIKEVPLISDFTAWLSQNNVLGAKESYLDYFMNKAPELNQELKTDFKIDNEIRTEKTYQVIFEAHQPTYAPILLFADIEQVPEDCVRFY
ncbi:MAG: hypothetical protein NTV63_02725 [Candidatus Woesearchaeota archaeon]|nr:hypothetical protein [Candidatus Woesearchaeota archaeon]